MQTSRRADPLSILQILISAMGLLMSVLAAGLFGIMGIAAVMGQSQALSQTTPMFIMAWVAAVLAALAIPSLLYAVLFVMDWKLPAFLLSIGRAINGYRLSWVLLLLWPLVIVLGNFIQNNQTIAWLLLPPLGVLAIGIPVWWVFEQTQRKLPGGTRQRKWGLVNLTFFVSFPVVFVAEILGLILMILLFVIGIISHPEWMAQLQQIMLNMQALRNNPEDLTILFQPYLTNPVVLYMIFTVYSGMAPLIEELLKPLAVWAMAGRKITPAEGFVAGATCGAAFALLESLFNLPGGVGGEWLALVIGRTGTALLHITTTALIGWALAYAWRNGAYVRLALTYLLSVSLHALWNGLSVLMIFRSFNGPIPESMQWASRAASVGPAGLIILAATFFIILMTSNHRLRIEERLNAPSESPAPTAQALPPETPGSSLP